MAQMKQQALGLDMGVPGLAGMTTALNPIGAKVWVDLMTEYAQFMTDRLNSTTALQQEMMTCRSPADVLALQSAYWRETMEQCSAEVSRYTALLMSSYGALSQDAKDGHRRGYDDVPV